MEPTVTLKNRTGRVLSFVLPHAVVCVRLGRCLCNKATGVPSSLLLPPSPAELSDLPGEVLEAPDVQIAKRLRSIEVRISTPPRRATAGGPKPAPKVETRHSAGKRTDRK
ncbi:MAG: hypothetical protein M0R37_15595 [Bacteroidales bacterium]|jgi:hypothetical protein|nr:hypothetical protein [Bacteroidales bacterium]